MIWIVLLLQEHFDKLILEQLFVLDLAKIEVKSPHVVLNPFKLDDPNCDRL